MQNRRVLEVACGTGFWTQRAAKTAAHILATDATVEMLEIARAKALPASVEFRVADAYALEKLSGTFDAGLAMFWFSHIPKARIATFLRGFHAALGNDATVFMGDSMYVEGVGGEVVQKPGMTDTFKIRTLADGSEHEVMKNYYEKEQLAVLFTPLVEDFRVEVRNCFWWVEYRTKNMPA
jgi:SAM-dependent methyltransferase